MNKREIFIIGAKGIPAKYGGFESFVEQLTARKKDTRIHYNIACRYDLSDNKTASYEYNGATCFNIKVPNIGPARAILYDVKAFEKTLDIIKNKKIQNPIVYVLACRMGPFIKHFKKQLDSYNGTLIVNPDGHEWLRAKWSYPVRMYWKYSEKLMVKNAELLVCDSQNIENYIQHDYVAFHPNTTYIAYGSDLKRSTLDAESQSVKDWFEKHNLQPKEYFLIVGRFVPENNYETMIREFMKSDSSKKLVIISNVEKNKFYKQLQDKTNFANDKRINFVGTVYDSELLKFIRENAFAYLHGHEVGGTNPSLLEAMGSTEVNLLLNVGFNKEVGEDGALYWTKKSGSLARLVDFVDNQDSHFRSDMNVKSNERIIKYFTWDRIISRYEQLFKNA